MPVEFVPAEWAKEWGSFVADLAQPLIAFGALVAATAAWRGLGAWQSQLIGQADHDLAGRILSHALNARDAVLEVREPYALFVAPTSEGKSTSCSGVADATIARYQERMRAVDRAIAELDVTLVEAEALWGDRLLGPRAHLGEAKSRLYRAIVDYFRVLRDEVNPLTRPNADAEAARHNADLFGFETESQKDVIGESLKAGVAEFEAALVPRMHHSRGSAQRKK